MPVSAEELVLEAVDVGCPLSFQYCYFDDAINFRATRIPALRLSGCYVPAIGQTDWRPQEMSASTMDFRHTLRST